MPRRPPPLAPSHLCSPPSPRPGPSPLLQQHGTRPPPPTVALHLPSCRIPTYAASERPLLRSAGDAQRAAPSPIAGGPRPMPSQNALRRAPRPSAVAASLISPSTPSQRRTCFQREILRRQRAAPPPLAPCPWRALFAPWRVATAGGEKRCASSPLLAPLPPPTPAPLVPSLPPPSKISPPRPHPPLCHHMHGDKSAAPLRASPRRAAPRRAAPRRAAPRGLFLRARNPAPNPHRKPKAPRARSRLSMASKRRGRGMYVREATALLSPPLATAPPLLLLPCPLSSGAPPRLLRELLSPPPPEEQRYHWERGSRPEHSLAARRAQSVWPCTPRLAPFLSTAPRTQPRVLPPHCCPPRQCAPRRAARPVAFAAPSMTMTSNLVRRLLLYYTAAQPPFDQPPPPKQQTQRKERPPSPYGTGKPLLSCPPPDARSFVRAWRLAPRDILHTH